MIFCDVWRWFIDYCYFAAHCKPLWSSTNWCEVGIYLFTYYYNPLLISLWDSCYIALELLDGTGSGFCGCCWVDRRFLNLWTIANDRTTDFLLHLISSICSLWWVKNLSCGFYFGVGEVISVFLKTNINLIYTNYVVLKKIIIFYLKYPCCSNDFELWMKLNLNQLCCLSKIIISYFEYLRIVLHKW